MENAPGRIHEHAIATSDVVSQVIGFTSANAKNLSGTTAERKRTADHGEVSTLIAVGAKGSGNEIQPQVHSFIRSE